MSKQEEEIRRLLGRTYDDAKRIAQRVAAQKTVESDEEAALIGALVLRLSNAEARAEYLANLHSLCIHEAQRLAFLVRRLGGDPETRNT